MKTQCGFSGLEAMLIIVIAGIISATGWYVWKSKTTVDHLNTQTAVDSKSANFSGKRKNPKFLTITEWNVQMPMNDASKVLYQYSGACNNPLGFGKCDSAITLEVKSELYKNKNCKISDGLYRYTTVDQVAVSSFKKIGKFYFTGSGNAYDCQNIHDNELNKKIRSEFDYTKLVTL